MDIHDRLPRRLAKDDKGDDRPGGGEPVPAGTKLG